jgi:hypothetical protein
MDIFKLIFHHDLLVEQLEGNEQNRTIAKASLSLEDFMKPMPQYSRFYLSGTELNHQKFGLSALDSFSAIIRELDTLFQEYSIFTNGVIQKISFGQMLEVLPTNSGFSLSKKETPNYILDLSGKEYIREYGKEIRTILEAGDIAIFKIESNDGFDIQIYTMINLYKELFYSLKSLLQPNFRLFSINGKKLTSDRLFYFETYSLMNPPHGVEEVFEGTVY